ncbi:uncharacterized protein LOC111627947 [Centruroides sculpturatus]|uniref:uncharacterized protein LOC111627947 n=1 Tax=Centruroides sculpturatus TaxID=218467 RepID=UPI000C6C8F52|nr:uncharacterized protein LOC111627947 [Centruroides sculpturatus]
MCSTRYYARMCTNCLLDRHKLVLTIVVLYTLVNCVSCDTCQFPAEWTGTWFQKGVQDPIRIENGTISTKGVCRKADGDKFIIENKYDRCFRCMALYEKHPNVIQYKETYCFPTPDEISIALICKKINGDALLFSMFRLNTPPVPCPFEGPYVFSYSQGGHKECSDPPSTVDTCTENSRLLFKFQACHFVLVSESKTEELRCLATWKEGSKFLVGRLVHKHAHSDEEEFRCFVYEKVEDEDKYLISQSGDATCDGMFSATEGSRTMKLTKVNYSHDRCQFPSWMVCSPEWKTLNGLQTYNLTEENNSYNIYNATSGKLVTKVLCSREDQKTVTYTQYVVHVTSDCNIGYSCLRIHQRAPHVVEMQTGKVVNNEAEACNNFDPLSSDFVTLTSVMAKPRVCPLVGIYFLEGSHVQLAHYHSPEIVTTSCSEYAILTSGCSMGEDRMDLLQECASSKRTLGFNCHGNWEENGTHYVIVSSTGAKNHLCIAYTENEKSLQFSGSLETCPRNIQLGRDGLIALNGTNRGLCQDNSAPINHITSVTMLFSVLLTFSLVSHCFR